MIYLHRCLRICKDAREFIKSAETIYIYIYMYWTILPLYINACLRMGPPASSYLVVHLVLKPTRFVPADTFVLRAHCNYAQSALSMWSYNE